jgi:AcrR family transcriptional regulator
MARPADPHARASLIAAARREFVRHGIQRARIEDITAACGLSKGAFYLHFESKEALFQELVEVLMRAFEAHRALREEAQRMFDLGSRRVTPRLVAELGEAELRADRQLLELLWEWRDVSDVLLRGSQGTVFEGVMWSMLDREVERVAQDCAALKHSHLMRADVPADVVGLMVVGTYLLVARKLVTMEERPDFDHWVRALHALLAEGMRPRVPAPSRRPRRRPVPRSPARRPARRR